MNVAQWLVRTAAEHPERPALLHGTDVVASYAEWRDRALALARWLRGQGIAPGDRVAIFMQNGTDYLVVLHGAWMAGAVVVPINAKLHAREAEWIARDAGATLCFVAAGTELDHSRRVDPAHFAITTATAPVTASVAGGGPLDVETRAPDDAAWLFYTSGTTGRPKGVVITHGMLVAMSLSYLHDVDEVRPDDAACYAAPMSHGAGLYALVHTLRGAAHLCPPSGGFDAAELLALAREHGSLSLFLAPTMVQRLTRAARAANDRGEGLRSVIYGGGPMYVADITDALEWFGAKFVQIYGQGECPMSITALSREEIADREHPDWARRIASVGRAQAAVEVIVGDQRGAPVAAGEVGEIRVRGLPVMPRYWRAPEASAAALRDGWLLTGDRGTLDADGYLTLKDRSKDVIISGGTNIYPREVEEALLTHPDVTEVSVVGRASPEWGEEVVAFVVTSGPVDAETLGAHCSARIARFKRPKAFRFVAELPKNSYGKVLKSALRERLD